MYKTPQKNPKQVEHLSSQLCFSGVSHASHPISLPTRVTRSYPRNLMVPQPSHPNYHQILSCLLPKYIYQISPLVSTWQCLSTFCSLLPFSVLFSELLECKSDLSHCPEDIWNSCYCLLSHAPGKPFLDGLLFLSAHWLLFSCTGLGYLLPGRLSFPLNSFSYIILVSAWKHFLRESWSVTPSLPWSKSASLVNILISWAFSSITLSSL